ncbi:hypothetical protein QK292_17930 [Arthrobacter sp. AL08]|nr:MULTISPECIES: hypothetical protein [unclassified Arthrobacter]MDI3243417.1 hypothetical protein [Arthrobacter sp. AL05]MDI3279430.1 hypothetical protein [Arthrobacter sp. AL08]
MDSSKNLPVAAIGAGTIGLAAAAVAIEQRRRVRLSSRRDRVIP